MNRKKVAVTGYYGCGNLGDEALREALVAALGEAGIESVVIAGRGRFHPERIACVLRKSAGLVLGGGGLLQNATSARSLYYYLGLIVLARTLHRPVFLLGQGLGPITGTRARAVTRRVLSGVDYLGVRDQKSLRLASQIGAEAELDGDLFFLNPPEPAARPRLSPPWIGIVLSGRSIAGRLDDWARLLGKIPAAQEIVFIPFFPREDLAVAEKLARVLPHACVEIPHTVAGAQGLIHGLSLLISSRLHPLEFALYAGVPMVAIPADPKIAAFVLEVKVLSGLEIPCMEHPQVEDISALLDDSSPKKRFAAAYMALHRRTKAGFERFLNVLFARIEGGDG